VTFFLSSTFTDSLARLAAEEQKLAKTTAFDLQVNPANPGHQLHRLDAARDKDFWSVRVSSDLRIIVHKTDTSLLLCYVAHHDKAYAWAERRKLETHPNTGASQIVEIRETFKDITVPRFIKEPDTHTAQAHLFSHFKDVEILDWGVPAEWVADVKTATEDTILELADHLPAEAAEAVLEAATGGRPRVRRAISVQADPFSHPDAMRRFRMLDTPAELDRALDSPWDSWINFLHPDQRELIERDFAGPARVSGSAGTGKTIVALHRACFLAKKDENSRVLLVTFSDILANALRQRLIRLVSSTPKLAERIEVHSMESLGMRLFRQYRIEKKLIGETDLAAYLLEAAKNVPAHGFSFSFLQGEWTEIVDAWHIKDWESYRDIPRLGRKIRLPESRRKTLWSIFSRVRDRLEKENLITNSGMYAILADMVRERKHPPYEYVVMDEAQDISVPQLRFFASFGTDVPNRLMFCGDTGQRIFRQGFSWQAQGVEIRGRSTTFSVNYRTSHQIRRRADLLLDREVHDADGNTEDRSSTVSVFNGPEPVISSCESIEAEKNTVLRWIASLVTEGIALHEICLCVRSKEQMRRVHEAAIDTGLPFNVLDEYVNTVTGKLVLCTMHLAKGLEFRAVAIMACDEGIIPSEERLSDISDPSDLEEVYTTERQLLYVACTRARDYLLITSGGEPSEFVRDLS